jgi:ribonuclease inhibitor
MTRALVDLTGIGSVAEAYDRLAKGLALPGHFGRNLDALWDALANDVPGPFSIRWQGGKAAAPALGVEGERLLALIEELERRRTDVQVRLE